MLLTTDAEISPRGFKATSGLPSGTELQEDASPLPSVAGRS